MISVNFYQVENSDIQILLFKLLEKTSIQGMKVLVRTDSHTVSKQIDEFLWSYDLSSFIPHGTSDSPSSNFFPVLISEQSENLNNANFLFYIGTSNFLVSEIQKFEKTFILLGNDDLVHLQSARKLWRDLAKIGVQQSYWTQENKRWVLRETE